MPCYLPKPYLLPQSHTDLVSRTSDHSTLFCVALSPLCSPRWPWLKDLGERPALALLQASSWSSLLTSGPSLVSTASLGSDTQHGPGLLCVPQECLRYVILVRRGRKLSDMLHHTPQTRGGVRMGLGFPRGDKPQD